MAPVRPCFKLVALVTTLFVTNCETEYSEVFSVWCKYFPTTLTMYIKLVYVICSLYKYTQIIIPFRS